MESEEQRRAGEALSRVRALEVPGAATFQLLCDVPLALASDPLDANAARALWERLRGERKALGLVPVVVDVQVELELDADAATADLSAAASLSPEHFVDARRRAHKRFWLDALAGAEADKQGAEPETLPDELSYAQLSRRGRAVGIECPERDPHADELASLASLSPGVADREARPGDFSYVGRDALFAGFGLDVDPLRARVLLWDAPVCELPAHLGWGGWNQCPPPAAHVAMLRSWHERFAAELAFVGPDTLELSVARPPATTAELRELAWEQYIYCSDIVHQHAGTLDALALDLAGSPRWFFWWD